LFSGVISYNIPSFFLTYHRILNKSTVMGATSGTGTAFSSGASEFMLVGFVPSEFMPNVSGVRGI
jgi:hypothetical protein